MPLIGLSCKTELHSIDVYNLSIRTGERRGAFPIHFWTKKHGFQQLVRTQLCNFHLAEELSLLMWPVHQIADMQLVDLIQCIFKVKVASKRFGFSSPGKRNCSSQENYIMRWYIQMQSWKVGYSEGSLTPAYPHSGSSQTVQCLTWGWTIQISFPEKGKH